MTLDGTQGSLLRKAAGVVLRCLLALVLVVCFSLPVFPSGWTSGGQSYADSVAAVSYDFAETAIHLSSGDLYDAQGNKVVIPEIGDANLKAYNHTKAASVPTYTSVGTSKITLAGYVTWIDDNDQPLNESAGKYDVVWASSNEAVAKIDSQNGIITPVSDGTCDISMTCTVQGTAYTALFHLVTTETSTSPYVSAIRVYRSDTGDEVASRVEITEESAVAAVTFYAEADVVDPVAGTTITYSTQNGLLSEQGAGVGDLEWSTDASNVIGLTPNGGYVEARCLDYGSGDIFCIWDSVTDGAYKYFALKFKDPDNPEISEDHHRDTLTIRAYWVDKTTGEKHYVVNQDTGTDEFNFSVEDVTYAMVPEYRRFTLRGESGSWFTEVGYGVDLESVLNCVGIGKDEDGKYNGDGSTGINVKDIVSLYFVSDVDEYSKAESGSFFFGTRYFYPSLGSSADQYSDGQVVKPMLAVTAYSGPKGESLVDVTDLSSLPLTYATRFRLLIGATQEGGNASYCVKWVSTIEVELKPPSSGSGDDPDDPDPDPGDDDDDDDDGDDDGDGEGSGTGGGTGDGTGSGNGYSGAIAGSSSTGGGSGDSGSGGGGKQYAIYQVMNANDSAVDKSIDYDNPLKDIAPWAGLLVFVASGAGYYIWFRRQCRPVPGDGYAKER